MGVLSFTYNQSNIGAIVLYLNILKAKYRLFSGNNFRIFAISVLIFSFSLSLSLSPFLSKEIREKKI